MSEIRPVQLKSEHPEHQFRFLLNEVEKGTRCALVTIVGIVGTASRNLGSHMVVTEDGRFAGSVSSGCADASVATFALEALASGQSKRLQLGAGSNFVDIQLPCGGGVDLLINPDPDKKILKELVTSLAERKPSTLFISSTDLLQRNGYEQYTPYWSQNQFVAPYTPNLKLILAGRGSELSSFCKLAIASGFDVEALSPDASDLATCKTLGAPCTQLKSPALSLQLSTDPWTAVVLLFHDHDWEPPLLEAALAGNAFYIGALGSKKTHTARLEMMRSRGVADESLARVKGPIGLVPSMRNAPMLAISTLAEIVEAYNQYATIRTDSRTSTRLL